MTLPAPLRNLAAVLRQEARQGYQDRAVMRGLDLLLANGKNAAAPGDLLPPDPPRPYADLAPDERRSWIDAVLAWLDTLAPVQNPSHQPPPPGGSGGSLSARGAGTMRIANASALGQSRATPST